MKNLILLLAVVLGASHASAQNIKAVFNTPKFSGQASLTIENELISLIDSSVSGSTIHFSIYQFQRPVIANALLRANARGVNVKGVFDGGLKKEAKVADSAVGLLLKGNPALQLPALKCLTKDCIKFCTSYIIGGSCRAMQNNHNKFMMFSQLKDGRSNVVALTSANWNAGQWRNHNDLLILANDAKLYSGTLSYWKGLMNSRLAVPLYIKGSTALIYTFPNKQIDPIAALLNQVSCELPGSKIRVMQSRFLDDRKAVAQRLAELSKQGCDVRVLTRDEPNKKSPGPNVKAILGSLQTIIRYKGDGATGLPSIHSKVIAIDASVNGSPTRLPIVLAGSHNLNGNSLKYNDELLARVNNRSILDSYMKYWDETVAAAYAANMVIQ